MSKFEIVRTDINKIVSKAYDFRDEDAALGEYISALMLVGLVKMNNSPAEQIGEHQYRLSNGWTIQINQVN